MLANLGFFALIIALISALYACGAAVYATRTRQTNWLESARLATIITWPLLTAACLSLIVLLSTGQFHVAYVSSVSSQAMPWYLKVTALWGGQAGSLLFWAWLLATFTSLVQFRDWTRERDLQPWVIVASMVTLAFFLGITIIFENPFDKLWVNNLNTTVSGIFQPAGTQPFAPGDGRGLNPLLRHPGMIIHPPMLYIGFVGFIVPFSFAFAALVVGRKDDVWMRVTRRWSLVAWLFLSLGLILGGRWAYDVLGWGGYWGWDPVEVAALMPWLTGTAYLHSVMIQEKRGMFKRWNVILITATYGLVVYGTFLTRSGVMSSVHAFAESEIGPPFLGFIALTIITTLALLTQRWDILRDDHHLDTWFSREGLFLLNNILFVGILVTCLWGVHYPMITELFMGQKATVGPPYYERTAGPMFIGILLLMGIGPLAAWRQATTRALGRLLWQPTLASVIITALWAVLGRLTNPGAIFGIWLAVFVGCVTLYEFWRAARARQHSKKENLLTALWYLLGRDRRRYGGYIIHLGVVLMAIGIVGNELLQMETQATVGYGEQITLDRYTMTYDELIEFPTDDGRIVTRATVTVYQDGRKLTTLYPRRDFFVDSRQPMTIPGVRSSIQDDFYVLIVGWEPVAAAGATFKVFVNPLVNWLWFGSLIFIAGTLVAAWPDQRESERLAHARDKYARAAGLTP